VIIKTQYLFYPIYGVILAIIFLANIFINKYKEIQLGRYIYNNSDIFSLLLISFSFSFIIFFIFRHIIIKYNLSSKSKYGDLSSNTPFELIGKSLLYAQFELFLDKTTIFTEGRDFISLESKKVYADDIIFKTSNNTIDYTEQFKNIKNFESQKKLFKYTYRELMDNYENLQLDKVITKEKINYYFEKKGYYQFAIEVNYIENNNNKRKDIIYEDKTLLSDYSFDYKKFIFVVIIALFIPFEFQGDTEQEYFTLVLKALQYSVFSYAILFLIMKKNLTI